MSRSSLPSARLAKAFAFSLVPIAIAYHATHYVPSLLMQLPALVPQLPIRSVRAGRLFPARASSPTRFRWRSCGMRRSSCCWRGMWRPSFCAHMAALEIFPTRSQGVASQLPMLA